METTDRTLEKLLADAEKQGLNDWYVKIIIRRAFHAGLALDAPTDPLAGYSNLTAAIKAGDQIDWEKLDGLNVKCVNPDVGKLRGVLVRNRRLKPDTSDAWWGESETASYINALYDGWHGERGWTLWIEGEVPLRRKTAEQLKVGTYFLGQNPNFEDASLVCVGGWNIPDCKSIYYAPSLLKSDFSPAEWVVIKEYGTFQKPEGK